ncbi:MAG: hypothetical protein AB7T06_28195 [Kofleriaceae bacterium]
MSEPERPWYERATNWVGERADEVGSVVGDFAGVMDAAGDLGKNVPDVGPLGDVADIVSGAGKVLHWDENGNWDPNHGGWGDIVSGGAGLAEGPLKMAPGVGPAIGGTAQALANGYQAYTKFDEMSRETDPARRAELEREAWGSTGDATLGALHAGIGSWCPVAELYISAGELALDGLGTAAGWAGGDDAKFGAGDVVGGLLDAIIPEEEDAISNRAGNWVHDSVGGGTLGTVLGAGAAGLTNVVAAPVNILDATAGGIVNTVGNMFDDDSGPGGSQRDDYWGQFKNWAGDGISSGASAAWDWAGDTANSVATGAGEAWDATTNAVSNTASTVARGAGRAWDATTNAVSNTASTVARGAGRAWDATTNAVSNTASTVARGAGRAWDATTNAVSNTASTVARGAGRAWDATTDAVSNTASTVARGAGRAWDATTGAVSGAASSVSNAASSAWNWLTGD